MACVWVCSLCQSVVFSVCVCGLFVNHCALSSDALFWGLFVVCVFVCVYVRVLFVLYCVMVYGVFVFVCFLCVVLVVCVLLFKCVWMCVVGDVLCGAVCVVAGL